MQANKKTREGPQHSDRDSAVAHINQVVTAALAARHPVISIDTKKRELHSGANGQPLSRGRLVEPEREPP